MARLRRIPTRGRRPISPRLAFIFAAVGYLISILLIFASTSERAQTNRTQAAPIQVGQVVSMHEFRHTSRSSTYYTSTYEVTLANGAVTTVHAHGTENQGLLHGRVPVVVDPKHPTWAEFPGYPYYKASRVVVSYVVLLWPLILTAMGIAGLRRKRRLAAPPDWMIGQPTGETPYR